MGRHSANMKQRAFLVFCSMCILIGCDESPPPDDPNYATSSSQYETELGHFDCNSYSPLDFLRYLQLKQRELPENAIGSVTIWPSSSWIKRNHLAPLAALLDSERPCVHVVSMLASTGPEEPSTVGQEAAFLMEGFRRGKYPPALISGFVDIADLKAWWRLFSTGGQTW